MMDYLLPALFLSIQAIIILLIGINIRTTNLTHNEIGKLGVWSQQHEKQDDERHGIERENRGEMWSEINKLKTKTGTG